MKYSSKILLIGEHTVLFGSQALSIPFDKYFGEWSFSDSENALLFDLLDKLDDSLINVELFKKDCQNGLSFKSTIPQQFGLGSSGALTAAIYRSYAYEMNTDIRLIQNDLAKIESIFHGQSSGTDALVSFTNATIHSKENRSIVIENNLLETIPAFVYLYNSSVKRSAKTFIHQFQELVDLKRFDISELCKLVDRLIEGLLVDVGFNLWDQLKSLSEFQYSNFQSFIPDSVRPIWKDGNQNDSFYFKLCGAGGGGFFLVFSKEDIRELYPDKLIPLNDSH